MATPRTDLGSSVKSVIAGASVASTAPAIVTAGGAGDATKVTGQTIDRKGYYSGVLAVGWYAELADTKTFSLAVEIQESDNASSWDTAVALLAATVVATGDSPTTDFHGVTELDINFKGRKRYARFNVTPDLSNTSADLAVWTAVCTLGGADQLPAS